MLLSLLLLFVACNDDEGATGKKDSNGDGTEAVIKMKYNAPHGDRSFAATFVVMDGDTVAQALIDEYQFMDNPDVTGVPNSDEGFGDGSGDMTLISKLANDDIYSENMKAAGSTITYANNLKAIEDFAIGKTLAEIEEAIADLGELGEDDDITDVVSGATFVDTDGYLQAIVDTAKDGFEFKGVKSTDLAGAELSYSLQPPHGTRSFAAVAVLHDGDNVLAATLDEFQYLDPADFDGVPNSDGNFGENYNEGVVLASKIFNDDGYSAMMTNSAGATSTYVKNIQDIIKHATGSSVADIEETITELNGLGEDDDISDVVSGATFVDTAGYLQAIVDTVK